MKKLLTFVLLLSGLVAQQPRHQSGRYYHRNCGQHVNYDPVIHRAKPAIVPRTTIIITTTHGGVIPLRTVKLRTVKIICV